MLEIFKCLRTPFMSLHKVVMILIQASAALHYLLFFYMNFALKTSLSISNMTRCPNRPE